LKTLTGFANVLHYKYINLHYYIPALDNYQVKTEAFCKTIKTFVPVKMALIFAVPFDTQKILFFWWDLPMLWVGSETC